MGKRTMILAVIGVASVSVAADAQDTAPAGREPAGATATAGELRRGGQLKTADGRRLGSINEISKGSDGTPVSANLIYNGRYVHIPANTITGTDATHFTTSLKARDVDGL